MDGPGRHEAGGLEVAEGLEVLDGDGLVVLGAAGEDAAAGVTYGSEGRVDPT